jgi:hypothetical protein
MSGCALGKWRVSATTEHPFELRGKVDVDAELIVDEVGKQDHALSELISTISASE